MSEQLHLLLVSCIAALLLAQLRHAVNRQRPASIVVTLALIVYFGYGLLSLLTRSNFAFYFVPTNEERDAAILLLLLTCVAIGLGYWIPFTGRVKRTRSSPLSTGSDLSKVVARGRAERYTVLLSSLGLTALILFVILRGGIVATWTREGEQVAGAGLLFTLTNLTLVNPLFSYYRSERLRGWPLLFLLAYVLYALTSGRTTQHIVNLIPFAIIWISRRRPSYVRLLGLGLGGLLILTGLRYFRFVGTLYVSGHWPGVADFFGTSNPLNPLNSFGEIEVFAKTIGVLRKEEFLEGRTYLVGLINLVPGFLLHTKDLLLEELRADSFLPRHFGLPGQHWPSGFYGEAYLNFGSLGLAFAGIAFGKLIRISDRLFSSSMGGTLAVPHWYAGSVLAAALVLAIRMDSGAALSVLTQLVAFAVARVCFSPITSLRSPPTRTTTCSVHRLGAQNRTERSN